MKPERVTSEAPSRPPGTTPPPGPPKGGEAPLPDETTPAVDAHIPHPGVDEDVADGVLRWRRLGTCTPLVAALLDKRPEYTPVDAVQRVARVVGRQVRHPSGGGPART